MNQLTESDIMQLLGQTTRTTTATATVDEPKDAKQEQKQNLDDPIPSNWPFHTNPICTANANNIELLKSKTAALEAKNRFLEGKLDTMGTKAKIHELNVKTNFAIVKDNNEALAKIIATFKDELKLEQQQKMDEFKVEQQRKMDVLNDEFGKMLTQQNVQHQKQIAQWEVKNKATEEQLKTAQMVLCQCEERVQANEQKIAELTKEMAIVKEQHGNEQPIAGAQPESKERKLENPTANWLMRSNPSAVADRFKPVWHHLVGQKGFSISGQHCRLDNFRGTIVYYYEVTKKPSSMGKFYVGLSDGTGNIPAHTFVGQVENSFSLLHDRLYTCLISGQAHYFQWPTLAIKPQWNSPAGDVVGCGLLLNPKNELAIFFTLNGILLSIPIPINYTGGDVLYPTVTKWWLASVEANFDGNEAKPFRYDIEKCPGIKF